MRARRARKNRLSNRRYYIALAILAVFFAAFYLLRGDSAVADFVVQYITTPYKHFMGRLCSMAPFSVAELCWALGILFCLWYVVHWVHCIVCGKGQRLRVLWHGALGAAVVGLCVYAGFTLLWGFNYYATSFEEKADIQTTAISVEELTLVTQLFADKLNTASGKVTRTEDDLFSIDRNTILQESETLYDNLIKTYPFLESVNVTPKGMVFSRIMSEINYTGFFFPFTGEPNLNMDAPAAFFPSTVAHELAHVHNIAPEQTANFVAVLACESSGMADFEYSGYMLGYLHLANALFSADREAWADISAQLNSEVVADFEYNNVYWQRFTSPAATAANTAYEGFLQGYSQTLGLKSYGAVVDLLVAYYLPEAQAAA
jgi:hypothetical protein